MKWRLFGLLLALLLSCRSEEPIVLKRLGGGEVELGRSESPKLLYFFSITCPSCLRELPEVDRLARTRKGVETVAIPLPSDPPAQVASLVDKLGLELEVAFDLKGEAARRFRVEAVPLFLLLDRSGRIVWRHLGPVAEEKLAQIINR